MTDPKKDPALTAAADGAQAIIPFDAGWEKIHRDGIMKLRAMIQQNSATSSSSGNDSEEKKPPLSFTPQEYAPLYTTVYNMCIQKPPYCWTPQLYVKFESSFREYLTEEVLPKVSKQHGPFMLKELVRRYEDHKIMDKWMCNFFTYLNRFYIKRHAKAQLQDVALTAFRTLVFDVIQKQVTTAVLDLIEADRNGKDVDRDLLHETLSIYVAMGMGTLSVYVDQFETPFIDATKVFYTTHSNQWLETDSCPEYLLKAERRFEDEKKRLTDYLHLHSESKLMRVLYETTLLSRQEEVLGKENTGCRVMLQTHATEDLERMFRLYNLVPTSLTSIAKMVKEHITQVGMDLIDRINAQTGQDNNDEDKRDEEDDKEAKVGDKQAVKPDTKQEDFIEQLIAMHDKYAQLVQVAFHDNSVFHKALKEAFETIVNKATTRAGTAELLANYADRLLRKGGIVFNTEDDLHNALDKVVRLFTYLTEKDLFSEFYRKLLSKRLLLQRSASTDAEKAMIGKLKLRCGAQFTSKLEGMINDMRNADQHRVAFRDFCRDAMVKLDIDFTVQVLTTGYWPTYTETDMTLPKDMLDCMETFKQYYNAKTNNRRLRWIHSLGVATVAGNFEKKRIDLVMSTIQARILELFNDQEEISIDDMIKLTGLTADDMKKNLKSLVQLKVLLKKPKEGYKTNHTMRANMAFTHQQRRVRVPHVSNKSTASERQTSQSSVSTDRKHAIEANIIRVMKARKTLDHANLITEVSQQLMQYFRPDPKDIKKRIEDLIAREYLERDEKKGNVYRYLA